MFIIDKIHLILTIHAAEPNRRNIINNIAISIGIVTVILVVILTTIVIAVGVITLIVIKRRTCMIIKL